MKQKHARSWLLIGGLALAAASLLIDRFTAASPKLAIAIAMLAIVALVAYTTVSEKKAK